MKTRQKIQSMKNDFLNSEYSFDVLCTFDDWMWFADKYSVGKCKNAKFNKKEWNKSFEAVGWMSRYLKIYKYHGKKMNDFARLLWWNI